MKTLANYLLFFVGLRKRYRVTGHSMWPVLRDGDVVFGKKVKNVQKNDIVVAKHPLRDMLVIKEVSRVVGSKIELRGRDDFGEDSRIFGLINHSAILAKIL